MDRLDRLELFTRIVEGGSFARAAQELRVARSTATNAINLLERETGVRLLARTTRHVATTPEGAAFYRRAKTILAEVEDTFSTFSEASPTGHLRIDASGLLTRTFLVPHLPAFLKRFPGLTISFSQGDRFVDIVRDGVDCALRAGHPEDSSLRMRKLGALPEITCASPDYLARHGRPRNFDDLDGHRMVGFLSSRTGEVMPLEFTRGGSTYHRRLPCVVSTDNSDTAAALALQGLGLIQAPRYRFATDLASGALIEVLETSPPEPIPLNAIHAGHRTVSRRLEVFLDWVKDLFSDADRPPV
ncbi:LysR family transcriptional regulator [Pseudooceanicola lipolyticus]|uniref:LysR family transcriptional regulator n=1 Tax=Pseudooceanicola lipolyticus TaxID=2029104 RepID=A0A2M8IWK0_9RHOB|nr:LysR family transcriptional regulator [Pseudooceanicola lipolyticus]PJE34919.1 LysR family transcriptional regulator [Pseudooceanicola lipolyticus]